MTASELGACFEELVIGLVIICLLIAPICRDQSIPPVLQTFRQTFEV